MLETVHGDRARTWAAIRVRLSVDHPWCVPALFRAVPVHRPRSTPDAPTADADRWGRVYLDFTDVDDAGIGPLADAVLAAVLDWVSRQAATRPWHAPRTDDRFPAVPAAEAERAGRKAAAGLHAAPADRYRDQFAPWRDWAQRTAGPPRVTWQQHLGATIRARLATQAGHQLYTYTRPARRAQPGILMASRRGPRLDVAVVADISGSVEQQLPDLLAEIDGIVTATGVTGGQVTVYGCDDEVAWTSRAVSGLRMAAREGHGTDLRPGIAAAVTGAGANGHRPDVVVVLTDGHTPWPDHPGHRHVIVALVDTGTLTQDTIDAVPTWATALRIQI